MAPWRAAASRTVGRCRRAALVGAIVVLAGCQDDVETYPRDFELQPPITARDHAAARHALGFAATLQRGDARAACAAARGPARTILSCSTKPRIPRGLRIPPRQKLEAVHSYPGEAQESIHIGIDTPVTSLLMIEVDEGGHVLDLTTFGVA